MRTERCDRLSMLDSCLAGRLRDRDLGHDAYLVFHCSFHCGRSRDAMQDCFERSMLKGEHHISNTCCALIVMDPLVTSQKPRGFGLRRTSFVWRECMAIPRIPSRMAGLGRQHAFLGYFRTADVQDFCVAVCLYDKKDVVYLWHRIRR